MNQDKHGNGFIDMTNWVMKEHGVPDSKLTVLSYSGQGGIYERLY